MTRTAGVRTDAEDRRVEGPSQVAVMRALRRVLDSSVFRSAPRSRDLLAFVVAETLAGRGHRLKERTVARGGLGRSPGFDGRSDPSVRVQAGRVRAALERYYATEGADESIRIGLPRGSYVATFEPLGPGSDAHGEAGPTPGATGLPPSRAAVPHQRRGEGLGPGVVVVQLADLRPDTSPANTAVALTASLVQALSRFPGLRVIGPTVGEQGAGAAVDVRATAREFDAQYVLTGAIRSSRTSWRLLARLHDGASSVVVWAETVERPVTTFSGFVDEDEVVRRVAGTVGDFRGAVHRDASRRSDLAGSQDVYGAMLAYYAYLDDTSPAKLEAARARLDRAVGVAPDNPVLLAMLASTYAVAAVMNWAPDRDTALRRAEALARSAIAVDAAHAQAWTALSLVSHGRGEVAQCREHAVRAIELAPDHPSVLYMAGAALAVSGDWNRALACIRASNRLNPHHPGYQHAYLALDLLLSGDHAGAYAEASLITQPEQLWGPLLRCLALAGIGRDDRAEEELAEVLRAEPTFLDNDAAVIIDTLLDVPLDVRVALRERLVGWLSGHDARTAIAGPATVTPSSRTVSRRRGPA